MKLKRHIWRHYDWAAFMLQICTVSLKTFIGAAAAVVAVVGTGPSDRHFVAFGLPEPAFLLPALPLLAPDPWPFHENICWRKPVRKSAAWNLFFVGFDLSTLRTIPKYRLDWSAKHPLCILSAWSRRHRCKRWNIFSGPLLPWYFHRIQPSSIPVKTKL